MNRAEEMIRVLNAGVIERDARIAELEATRKKIERLNGRQAETIKQYQELTAGGDVSLGMLRAECNQLRAELAAIKSATVAKPQVYECPRCGTGMQVDDSAKPSPVAKQVVMPERKTKADYSGYISAFDSEAAGIYNSALDDVAHLNAADQEGGV